jgi:hypothetical protein
VDRKPGNFYHGWAKTGGKTRYCAQPERTIAGHRFHTSDRFDFAESVQANPYYRPPKGLRHDSHIFNLYNVIPELDNTPVDDVTVVRQVFALRGEGVYLVNTRVENRSGAEHEYAQFFALPTWLPARNLDEAEAKVKALRDSGARMIRKDARQGLLATVNPGRRNLSIHLAANEALTYGNIIDRKGNHEALPPQPEVMAAALAKYRSRNVSERDFARNWLAFMVRPVSVRWTGGGNQTFQMVLVTREASDPEGLRTRQKTSGEGGVLGWALTTRSGTPVWFQAGPRMLNTLTAGPVQAEGEALMVMRKDGELSGIVLGSEAVVIEGKRHRLPTFDVEFSLDANGTFTSTPLRRPIDTVRISPAQTVFDKELEVSFSIPTQDTKDLEFRYTLDGRDPTLDSKVYTGPFKLDRTAMIKVRPFRRGLTETPWNFPGIDAGKTMTAIMTKVDPKPARTVEGVAPGLTYEYLEGNWPDLFMNAAAPGVIPVADTGTVTGLLRPEEVARIRKSDGPYAIRTTGLLDVPRDGVYVFHAPEHLFDVTMDAGFDLRLWVDGEEWFPSPGLHAENRWSVALKKGLHDFKVIFVDFRSKSFKNEYWLPWQEEQVWQGLPTLRLSGPGMKMQPLPSAWLKRCR